MTVTRTAAVLFAVLLALLGCANSPTLAQAAIGFSPQQMLDSLAKSLPAGSRMGLPASFPSIFQGWTDTQKQAGLQVMVHRCALLYALEGDDPQAHLLPETMTQKEAAELAVSVCLPAKMPADWPERQKNIDNSKRLIAKANSQGARLRLPENLSEMK